MLSNHMHCLVLIITEVTKTARSAGLYESVRGVTYCDPSLRTLKTS